MKRDFLLRDPPARKRRPQRAHPRLLLNPSVAIASVGGAGLAPFAPGTVGTLFAFPLVYACASLSPAAKVLLYAVLLLIGLWAIVRSGPLLGNHDHPAIVIDETLAMAIALECVPGGAVAMIAAFAFFRLFDIVKPWPANIVDARFHNSFGVMGDDLVAALYTIAAVWALQAGLSLAGFAMP
jgi:phosphatidylglycerophosphatase A